VYDAVTTQAGYEKWIHSQSEFFTPGGKKRQRTEEVKRGDRYEWRWHGYSQEYFETGNILEANGRNRVRFTFAGKCEVSIFIKRERGVTIVELIQSEIPTDEKTKVRLYLGCSWGWEFYLTNMKSVLEGGLDLRNRDVNVKGVINA
jgi:uncharacterized protein YndB with AHSA1/START domain